MDRERHRAADRARFPEGTEGRGDPLRVSPAVLPRPPAPLGWGRGRPAIQGPPRQPLGWEGWAGSSHGTRQRFCLWCCLAGVAPKVPVSGGSPGGQQGPGGGNRLMLVGETWARFSRKGLGVSAPPQPPLPPASPQAHEQAAAQRGEEDQPLGSELAPGRWGQPCWHRGRQGAPAPSRPLRCRPPGTHPSPLASSWRTSPTSSRPWPATA